jgi:hypothetical protein
VSAKASKPAPKVIDLGQTTIRKGDTGGGKLKPGGSPKIEKRPK